MKFPPVETNPFRLADADIDIIRALAEGRCTTSAAAYLGMTRHQVCDRTKHIRAVMGVHSMASAILKAERLGMLAGVVV